MPLLAVAKPVLLVALAWLMAPVVHALAILLHAGRTILALSFVRPLALALEPLDLRLVALCQIVGRIVCALVVAELLGIAILALRAHLRPVSAIRTVARLLHLLLAVGHNDAIVMLGMLEIVLGKNRVTRQLRVARQRQVLLRDEIGCAPHFDVWTVGLKAPR